MFNAKFVSGEDRGPVLEVIVARMNFMAGNTNRKVRLVGLSTALANAGDLADWLNITDVCIFMIILYITMNMVNFRWVYTTFVLLYVRYQLKSILEGSQENIIVLEWQQ